MIKRLGLHQIGLELLKAHPLDTRQSISKGFANSLLRLKRLTIDWAKYKRKKDDLNLLNIELKLASLEDVDGRGYSFVEAKSYLIGLEAERNRIVNDREETW